MKKVAYRFCRCDEVGWRREHSDSHQFGIRKSGSKPLRMAIRTLMIGLALTFATAACSDVSTNTPAGPDGRSAPLLSTIGGPRRDGDVLIDEKRGRVGALALGESLSAVKRLISPSYLWATNAGGFDLIYCSTPTIEACYGGALYLAAIQPNPAKKPSLNVIAIAPGNTRAGGIGDGRRAVTLRGVHPGDSLQRVLSRYRVDSKAPLCLDPPPGAIYYSRAGANSIAFEVQRHVVRYIVLLAGDRRLCY